MLPMPFEIRYSTKAVKQLRGCRAFDRATILDEIERTLIVNPTLQAEPKSRNCGNQLRRKFRLRVGNFRVFYDVDTANRVVNVE